MRVGVKKFISFFTLLLYQKQCYVHIKIKSFVKVIGWFWLTILFYSDCKHKQLNFQMAIMNINRWWKWGWWQFFSFVYASEFISTLSMLKLFPFIDWSDRRRLQRDEWDRSDITTTRASDGWWLIAHPAESVRLGRKSILLSDLRFLFIINQPYPLT